jgi:EPS-associated MarR family transcriptional regulator
MNIMFIIERTIMGVLSNSFICKIKIPETRWGGSVVLHKCYSKSQMQTIPFLQIDIQISMTIPDNNSITTELQFKVMRLLEANPQMNQRELSKSLGVSLGGVNYCLNALAAKGMIKIQNFRNNKNKWVYAYLLTPQGLAEKTALTGSFLKRKLQEYQSLKEEIEVLTLEMNNLNMDADLEVNLMDERNEKTS